MDVVDEAEVEVSALGRTRFATIVTRLGIRLKNAATGLMIYQEAKVTTATAIFMPLPHWLLKLTQPNRNRRNVNKKMLFFPQK